MPTALWLNPVFGVSGDMLLGAFLDLGASEEEVRLAVGGLGLDGWELRVGTTSRRGLDCRRAEVTAAESAHRPWSEIDQLLAGSGLEPSVKDGARQTFRLLAEVEASRHGVDVDEVIFHEVGAVDAIVDIVGSWVALISLAVHSVHSAAVGLGAGSVVASHGRIPHPAPAVLGLLEGLPVRSIDTSAETATPTGAALLKSMVDVWSGIPEGRLRRSGYGAGGRDPETHANLLAVAIVDIDEASSVESVLLETNLDDISPEVAAHVTELAMAEGADDVWVVPIVMKKGRAGHLLQILAPSPLVPSLIDLVARETGTLGVRTHKVTKSVFPRSYENVVIEGHTIAIKVGPFAAKPEFEDVKAVAVATGRSVLEITRAAMSAWLSGESE